MRNSYIVACLALFAAAVWIQFASQGKLEQFDMIEADDQRSSRTVAPEATELQSQLPTSPLQNLQATAKEEEEPLTDPQHQALLEELRLIQELTPADEFSFDPSDSNWTDLD